MLQTPRRSPARARRAPLQAAFGLAAVVAIFAVAAPAPAASASRALPRVIAGSYSGIRPRRLFFSGDAGNIVTGIRWARWTQTTAVGHGTSDIQGCVPNCAAGSETPVPTSVTLSRPRGGHFTKVVEVRRGHTLTAYYGRRATDWPAGGQQ